MLSSANNQLANSSELRNELSELELFKLEKIKYMRTYKERKKMAGIFSASSLSI
jgi:hypothetical protein